MSACGGIVLGSAYNCDNPIAPGVDQRLILINKADISTITFDVTTPTLITGITLVTGKQGFAFQGIRQSLNPQAAFVPQTVSVGYDHQIDFLCFDISQAQKDNLEKLGLTPVVGVVENRNSPGNADALFEVFGLNIGLELQTNTRINADLETQGAFSLSLKTSDNEGKEPKFPQNWFDTDYPTTKTKVDGLLVPAT